MNALKRRETEHSRDRQQQILYAIATYTKQHGYPPTVRDIAAEVGFKTPSAVRHNWTNFVIAGWWTGWTGPRARSGL